MARAACAGSELDFYDFSTLPAEGDNGALDGVKLGRLVTVCATRCPVIAECAAFALANHEPYGVWAGTTPKDRAQLHRADDSVRAVLGKAKENLDNYGAPKARQATLDEAEPDEGAAA